MSTVLFVVVLFDVVLFAGCFKYATDLNGFAVCTGDTVALRCGSLDDEFEVGSISRLAFQLECELGRGERDDCFHWCLYALEDRRVADGLATAGNAVALFQIWSTVLNGLDFRNGAAEIRKRCLRYSYKCKNPQQLPGIPTMSVEDFSRR